MKERLTKALFTLVALGVMGTAVPAIAHAENTDPPHTGHITGKSVLGGALSLIVWPGIGQAINSDKGAKVGTHALIGLFPPFRFWSGYDALVNRQGGYWDGKI